MFGKNKREKERIMDIYAQTIDLVDRFITDHQTMKREIEADRICGGWTTEGRELGLTIAKLPEGYNAVLFNNPMHKGRSVMCHLFIETGEEGLTLQGENGPLSVMTDPIEGTITLPGVGTFLRDDVIYQ